MIRFRLPCVAFAIGLAAALEPARADLALRWSADPADPARATVELTGLEVARVAELKGKLATPAEWQRLLSVRAEAKDASAGAALPAMAGSYMVKDEGISFRPLFPLAAGLNYIATANPGLIPGQTGKALSAQYQLPAREKAPATTVAQIYPSTATLPENLLKFYVHFSAPMSRGGIYEHVHLLDAAGKAVELPFLELDEELWNPAMTRLTLFIDPGRIKRGVRPLEEIGPALIAGERFRLIIDEKCRDAGGRSLDKAFEKSFLVGAPEREPLDPAKWVIKAPTSGTRAPLLVEFDRPLDHAMSQRVIRVVEQGNSAVAGAIEVGSEERTWKFTPNVAWRKGTPYELVIPIAIEDLAGNNIGKSFDVDLSQSDGEAGVASLPDVVRVPLNIH